MRDTLRYSVIVLCFCGMYACLKISHEWSEAKRYEAAQSTVRDSLEVDGKFRADSIRGARRYRSDSVKARGRR